MSVRAMSVCDFTVRVIPVRIITVRGVAVPSKLSDCCTPGLRV